eukprot:scaffold71442_cov56-Phaeocystis_antarctica.AAC.2
MRAARSATPHRKTLQLISPPKAASTTLALSISGKAPSTYLRQERAHRSAAAGARLEPAAHRAATARGCARVTALCGEATRRLSEGGRAARYTPHAHPLLQPLLAGGGVLDEVPLPNRHADAALLDEALDRLDLRHRDELPRGEACSVGGAECAEHVPDEMTRAVCAEGRACCDRSVGVLREVANTVVDAARLDANGGAAVLNWAGGGGASGGGAGGEMWTAAAAAGVVVAAAAGSASPCFQLTSCMYLLSLCGSTFSFAPGMTALRRAASAERACSKTTKALGLVERAKAAQVLRDEWDEHGVAAGRELVQVADPDRPVLQLIRRVARRLVGGVKVVGCVAVAVVVVGRARRRLGRGLVGLARLAAAAGQAVVALYRERVVALLQHKGGVVRVDHGDERIRPVALRARAADLD